MTLQIVASSLAQIANASGQKATRANDPDSIAAHRMVEEQFRKLAAMAQAALAELAILRAAPVAKPVTRQRKATISALEFWRRFGVARDAINAVYGDGWKVKAPFGETEQMIVPACWRSHKTERGTRLTWKRDHRMPAAQYWPDQRLPLGLVVVADYPRHVPGVEPLRDTKWYWAHGYIKQGMDWVNQSLAWTASVQAAQIAADLARGKDDQKLAEAAD